MKPLGKARVPTEQEFKRLAALSKTSLHGKRNFALIQFSFRLGLRACEMSGLRVRDVLDDQDRLREDVMLSANVTKGAKPRTLFLTNPVVRSALKDYLDDRREREGILFNLDAPLFKSGKGSKFSPNTMQQLFHRLHAAAGLDGGRSHSGRRWFATELIAKGCDLKSVSVLMGHASIAMTARYAEDNPQRLRRIVAEML